MEIENNRPGVTSPIHLSLVNPILLLGIPRELCLVMWTLGAAFAFGMRELWVLPIVIGLHIGFAILTQRDPHFFSVFRHALKTPKRLDP